MRFSKSLFKNAAKHLLLAVVTVAVTAVFGEIILRIKNSDGRNYTIEMWEYARELKTISADPELGHVHVRNTSAMLQGIDISINKAFTATQFGFPTRLFGDTIINMAPGIQYTPRLIIFPGGLAIKSGEVLIGGIGVSGATGDEDEECAQVGLDAIAGMLN